MGAWYTIGLFAGLGAALGVLLVGVLGSFLRGALIAFTGAVAIGAVLGFFLHDWKHALAGGLGAALGSHGSGRVVEGALGRGGTRGGTAVLVAAAAAVLAALAFVPGVGYVEAVALPLLGARIRARAERRYQGLRVLAKD